jgi:hypothetical protein
MKILILLYDKLKNSSRFLLKHFPFLISLLISSAALYYTIESRNDANKQFEQNTKKSDSLFNVQLKNERILNDSLISQIKGLQEITKKQLEITDNQLEEYKFSGTPKFQIGGTIIKDSIYINNTLFSPTILTEFKNVGGRFAYDCIFNNFLVYYDYSDIRASLIPKRTSIIEPNRVFNYEFKPQIPTKYKDNFYYAFEFSYYDKRIKKSFKQIEYLHYYKDRGKYTFYECNDEEKIKIKNIVNNFLIKNNELLFDQ